jgi:ribosomal protein S18 acetylase RimI-like enzyme
MTLPLPEYDVRNARPAEAPAIAEAQRVIAKTPGQLASRPEEIRDDDVRLKIEALTQSQRGRFIVAHQGDTLFGHALLDPHTRAVTAHVVTLTIAVHEGFQGRGVGRRLMTHLIDWARAHPVVEKLELQVRSSNARAMHLYASLGFVEEGRKTRRLKYGPGDYRDDVYMALWVGEP